MGEIGEDKLFSELLKNKLAFFVGSGISLDSPTDFPTGREFTSKLLTIFDNPVFDFSLQADPENPNKLSYGDMIRFETLLDVVSEFLDPDLRVITEVVGSRVPPNECHFLIALFLKAGCPIFTTNFDTKIEEACDVLEISFRSHSAVEDFRQFLSTGDIQDRSSPGPIFHLHGSIKDNRERLKTTISEVEVGLEPEVRKVLEKFFEGYTFIFLGYSGLDDFDLNPVLQDSALNAIWVQHDSDSHIPQVVELNSIVSKGPPDTLDWGWKRLVKRKCYDRGVRLTDKPIGLKVCKAHTLSFLRRFQRSLRIPANSFPVEEPQHNARHILERIINNYEEMLLQTPGKAELMAGILLVKMSRFREAEKLFQIALEKLESVTEKSDAVLSLLAECHHRLGISSYIHQRLDDAQAFHYKSLQIREDIRDEIGCIYSLHQLGNVSYMRDQYAKALNEFYFKALHLLEHQNLQSRKIMRYKAIILHQIALSLADFSEQTRFKNRRLSSEQIGQALLYAEDSLEANQSAGSFQGEAESNWLIGTIYMMAGNLDKPFNHFFKALEMLESLGDNLTLAQTHQNLGSLHHKWRDYDDAHQHWSKALEIYRRLGYKRGMDEVLSNLYSR